MMKMLATEQCDPKPRTSSPTLFTTAACLCVLALPVNLYRRETISVTYIYQDAVGDSKQTWNSRLTPQTPERDTRLDTIPEASLEAFVLVNGDDMKAITMKTTLKRRNEQDTWH